MIQNTNSRKPLAAQKKVAKKWRVPNRIFIASANLSDDILSFDGPLDMLGKSLVSLGHSVIFCKVGRNSLNDMNGKPIHITRRVVNGVQYLIINKYNSEISSKKEYLSSQSDFSYEKSIEIFKPSLIFIDLKDKFDLDIFSFMKYLDIPYVLSILGWNLSDGLESKSLDSYLNYFRDAKTIFSAERHPIALRLNDFKDTDFPIEYIEGSDIYSRNEVLEKFSGLCRENSLGKRNGGMISEIKRVEPLQKQNNSINELNLDPEFQELLLVFESGFSYTVKGSIERHDLEKKNPALIQFNFTGISDKNLFKVESKLSHSDNVGFYKYLQPINEGGKFEFDFHIPAGVEFNSALIKSWGAHKAVKIRSIVAISKGRNYSLSEEDLDKVRLLYNNIGLSDSKKKILSEKDISVHVKADKLEGLLAVSSAESNKSLEQLIYEIYALDYSIIRGKRLINKANERGMISLSAKISQELLLKNDCNPEELRVLRRVISKNLMREKLVEIPKISSGTDYQVNKLCSLYFAYSALPYQSNGYATRTHSLMEAMKLVGGWNVIPYTRPGYPWDLNLKNIALNDFDKVGDVIYRHLRGVNLFREELQTYFEGATNIIEVVAKNSAASILHAASNYVNAIPVVIAAKRLGIPFIYEIRGFWELSAKAKVDFDWSETEAYLMDREYEVHVAEHADAVIVITEGLKLDLVNRGIDGDKIHVIENGVDVEKFKPIDKDEQLFKKLGLHNAPTIGFVGSFAKYEGLDDLISAAAELSNRGHQFNLLLVGDGEVFNSVQDLIIEADLSDRCFLTGRVPFEKIEHYYSLIDIAPLPRKSLEVCELVSPLKPFEIMAMGKVVLASSVDAMKEFIDEGVNGYLFDKGSINSLTDRLEFLLLNTQDLKKVGDSARKWVSENRTWISRAKLLRDLNLEISQKWFEEG